MRGACPANAGARPAATETPESRGTALRTSDDNSASAIAKPRLPCELRVKGPPPPDTGRKQLATVIPARALIARRLRRSQIGLWLSAFVGERRGHPAVEVRSAAGHYVRSMCDTIEQRMSLSRFGGCLYGPPHRDAISCRGSMTRTSTANVINGFREVRFVTPQAPEDLLTSVNTDACHGVASTSNPRF